MSLLLLWLGGVTGAICRYHVGRIAQRGIIFPVSTIVINVSGSLALGLLTAQLATIPGQQGNQLVLLLGVGFCGAYTTFSTFAWETVELWQTQHRGYALLNVCVQPVAASLAAWLGATLG